MAAVFPPRKRLKDDWQERKSRPRHQRLTPKRKAWLRCLLPASVGDAPSGDRLQLCPPTAPTFFQPFRRSRGSQSHRSEATLRLPLSPQSFANLPPDVAVFRDAKEKEKEGTLASDSARAKARPQTQPAATSAQELTSRSSLSSFFHPPSFFFHIVRNIVRAHADLFTSLNPQISL